MLTRLLNQYRRDIIKPTLPLQFVKIAESAGINETIFVTLLHICLVSPRQKLLKDSESTPKQSYGKKAYQAHKDSSNYQSSSKTQKRTKQGQNY